MLRNADGWGGCQIFWKKRYEGVRFNVIGVTRGWFRGLQFPGEKRYVTLEWPLSVTVGISYILLHDQYVFSLLQFFHCYISLMVKASIWAISSDTHKLQFIKLHHFKLEIFKSI